uniref:Uncharacterized protein n=1 Tax=Noctiluca scintillans TaxID=2966 RepID=A0A7S0ZS20_NOCSC
MAQAIVVHQRVRLSGRQRRSRGAVMTMEEDPFAEFLTQDAQVSAAVEEPQEIDAGLQLKLLVESNKKQEQLLSKVCDLLVAVTEKVERLQGTQQQLEQRMAQITEGGIAGPPTGSFSGPPGGSFMGSNRGALVQPPGKAPLGPLGPQVPGPGPVNVPAPAGVSPAQRAEEQRLVQERLEAERLRVDEETRRRADELAKRKAEEERRRAEEEERLRVIEERKKEEERKRKQELESRTSGLMNNLLADDAGSSLFGDDLVAKNKSKKKGGLFDD